MLGFSRTAGGRRVVWLVVATVLGVAVATGAAWGLAGLTLMRTGPSAAPTEDGVTGQWTGTTYASNIRKTEWGVAGYMMRGDFWFRVDDKGNVDGHAMVFYEPVVDLSKLDSAVKYVKDVGNSAFGMLGLGSGLMALTAKGLKDEALATYTGLIAIPDKSKATISAPITGTLRDGRLSLRWKEEQSAEIPVTVVMRFIKKDKTLQKTGIALQSPWHDAGAVADPGSGLMAEAEARPKSVVDGVTTTTLRIWSAHRVG